MKTYRLSTFQVVRFGVLAFFFVRYLQDLVIEYGYTAGLQAGWLAWAFCVVCIPLARGYVLFSIPLALIGTRKYGIPELLSWTGALGLISYSYVFTPRIFFKTRITLLLYHLIRHPNPYYVIFALCAAALFFNAYCYHQTASRQVSTLRDTLALLLLVASYSTSLILLFAPAVSVFNTHGAP